jgi:tetratricopeptide (TPR) repeat protein
LVQIRLAALGDLEEALEFDAELPEAHVLIARLNLFPGGDLKLAQTSLDAVIKSKKADAETRSQAYVLRVAFQQKPDDRIADLSEAIRLNPSSAQAHRLRAAALLNQNKPDEAVADFDAALKIDPDNAATHEARGIALAAQQKWDEAKKSLSRAAELFPQSSGAILQRGRVNLLAGNPQDAVKDADEVLKLVPGMPEAMLLRSHAKLAAGDKAGALADVEKVLERTPTSAQALRARITIYLAEQKVSEAINDLELLYSEQPDQEDVVLQLAVLHNSLKHNRRTVELLDPVLVKDPANWRARRVRGDALLNLAKHREAIADYEAALKIEPKDSGLLNNLAWVLATSPKDEVRDGKRSVELATRACDETKYKEAHILSTLAAGYAEQSDFAEARKWSEKALEVAADGEKEGLRKELESYRAEKPWREALDESAGTAPPEKK